MENAITVLSPSDWTDYELIDSGDGDKLERFGSYIISRPDPRAIWTRQAPQSVWGNAHAAFVEDHWNIKTQPPRDWHVRYHDLKIGRASCRERV